MLGGLSGKSGDAEVISRVDLTVGSGRGCSRGGMPDPRWKGAKPPCGMTPVAMTMTRFSVGAGHVQKTTKPAWVLTRAVNSHRSPCRLSGRIGTEGFRATPLSGDVSPFLKA